MTRLVKREPKFTTAASSSLVVTSSDSNEIPLEIEAAEHKAAGKLRAIKQGYARRRRSHSSSHSSPSGELLEGLLQFRLDEGSEGRRGSSHGTALGRSWRRTIASAWDRTVHFRASGRAKIAAAGGGGGRRKNRSSRANKEEPQTSSTCSCSNCRGTSFYSSTSSGCSCSNCRPSNSSTCSTCERGNTPFKRPYGTFGRDIPVKENERRLRYWNKHHRSLPPEYPISLHEDLQSKLKETIIEKVWGTPTEKRKQQSDDR
eukprot:GHVH01000961.1.p1 GENE.GHVH01000961.1~~GHVH01000961.1.p1  ORF type:complete len:259 (-),score=30.25 GHVH01000961.1:48-824(-)